MNVLFVCNQGQNRSRTAAEMFSQRWATDFAGIHNGITEEQLSWADLVVVMEDTQRRFIGERFPSQYLKKRIVSLDIPDIYSHGQEELRSLLKDRIVPLTELE